MDDHTKRCVNCGLPFVDKWGRRKYCMQPECHQLARDEADERSRRNRRPSAAARAAPRPCRACGQPFTGVGQRRYCKDPECESRRGREESKEYFKRAQANPEKRAHMRESQNRRRKERRRDDAAYAERIRAEQRMTYAKKTGQRAE